ncbi:RNA polymerase sigma factor [Desulfolucanica intricata]|uniref:RNA polymerase sigma factor n=1 Tax=Desulfolucanica intricata TaxID=1285191 RepID=UPI000834189B|nr:sigma-70 family RNA polymerase sigma factor [Desulfolucanica intricata]
MVFTALRKKKERDYESLSFEELYDRHFAAVNRYLRYRITNTWDADDLTAIVFMKAMEKFYQYEGSGSFTAWLFRIAHNTMVDYFKLSKDFPSDNIFSLEISNEGPEEKVLCTEEIKILHDNVLKLPEEYRDVISLRYVGELRFKQIGEVIGKSEGAVRTIHHRALKMLRKMYGERTDN